METLLSFTLRDVFCIIFGDDFLVLKVITVIVIIVKEMHNVCEFRNDCF